MPDRTPSDIGGNFVLDERIIEALPKEVSKVVRVDSHGTSAWNKTARIKTELADGSGRSFFVKLHEGERGRVMVLGEYEAELAIFRAMPRLVPEPYCWGKCKEQSPPVFFILKDFCDMSFHLPEPIQFCEKIARLHEISRSPTGKFGFHVPTLQGSVEQRLGWDSSWASFFSKLIAASVHHDVEANGPWKEYEDAFTKMQEHVIPRLLGALESDGRTLIPKLIHGNLKDEHCGTSLETGDIKIYDACSYYAHSEMDVAMWRVEKVRFRSKTYTRQYLRNVGISEPVDEFDDRIRLYSIKHIINHSVDNKGSYFREKALEEMLFLIDKYALKEKVTKAPTEGQS